MNSKQVITLSCFILSSVFFYGKMLVEHNNVDVSAIRIKAVNVDSEENKEGVIPQNIKTALRNGELNEGRIITSDLTISRSNKIEPLRLIVDAKKTNLFLRIDDRDCIDCIDSSFQTIINSRMDTNKVKVIILGHYASINSEKFILKKIKFTKDFYNCDNLPLPAESVISPYFFTLDPSFRTKKVFFPVKEFPKYNITELKKIVNN